MLQLSYIQENKEDVLKRLAIKNFKDAESIINSVTIIKDPSIKMIRNSNAASSIE